MDRRRLLAVLAAVLAATVVVLVVAAASSTDSPTETASTTMSAPLEGAPPLVLALPDRYRPTGQPAQRVAALRRLGDPARDPQLALALASAQNDARNRAGAEASLDLAERRLGAGDVRLAVARAVVGYDAARPGRTTDELEALAAEHPADALPAFEAGMVSLFAGDRSAAETAFRRARDLDPDGLHGLEADNLLHPGMLRGYPPWLPSEPLPSGSLASLRKAADAHPSSAEDQLALASALSRIGRRTAAGEAARRAVAADPTSIDGQVAVAVLAFRKDAPQIAFGALGNLIKSNGQAVSPVFHLAVLLSWIGQREAARQELGKAADLAPDSRLGRAAAAGLKRSG